MKSPIFPSEASANAAQVDHLYFFLIIMSVFLMALILIPMIFFLFKYRRGNRADRSPLRVSTTKIEVTWTVLPLLLSMGIFGWGARVYFNIEVPPENVLEINVVGKQWMWKIQHNEGAREINELHIPVNQDIRLTMTSEDVPVSPV